LIDIPGRRSHEYFPQLSADGKWLVWAATQRGHDHDIADYEIYLWEVGTPAQDAVRLTYHSGNDRWPDIYIPGGGFQKRPYSDNAMLERDEWIPELAGREVFKAAVTKLPIVVKSLLAKHGVTLDDISCFVAHQANDRINEAVRETLGIPKDKVPTHIARNANTSGGTIAILMDELLREKRVKKGDLLCFLALGSGLHWGAALMRL